MLITSLKAGEITKVVTERLGHATTAYTQDAYQHVLPGMQRDAATRFHERLTRPRAVDGETPERADADDVDQRATNKETDHECLKPDGDDQAHGGV